MRESAAKRLRWNSTSVHGRPPTLCGRTEISEVLGGHGTLAPVAPPDVLIVTGAYRFVRNPMYLAVVAVIVGQAALLGRVVRLVWAAGFWMAAATFVRLYEEPHLSRRFGDQYAAYRRGVRAWVPRVRPWSPDSS